MGQVAQSASDDTAMPNANAQPNVNGSVMGGGVLLLKSTTGEPNT